MNRQNDFQFLVAQMGHCITCPGIGHKVFKGILEGLVQTLPLHWSTHHFCVNQTYYCKHPWLLAFLSYKDAPSWTLNRHKGKRALRTSSHCNKIYSFQASQRSEVHPTTFPEASSSVSHKLPPTITCHLAPSFSNAVVPRAFYIMSPVEWALAGHSGNQFMNSICLSSLLLFFSHSSLSDFFVCNFLMQVGVWLPLQSLHIELWCLPGYWSDMRTSVS